MRNIITGAIFAFTLLTVATSTPAFAISHDFSKGAYIIPMDSVMQPEGPGGAGGGILNAYGLVMNILENGGTVYWMMNGAKTQIDGIDFTISATSGRAVSNKTGSTAPTTSSVDYIGAPFVVEADASLPQSDLDAIVGHADWSDVKVHQASNAFTANVGKKLTGIPPKLAVMDNEEADSSGNHNGKYKSLQGYLTMAGICPDIYDVLSPNDVGKRGMLNDPAKGYTTFWAPHWAPHGDGAWSTPDIDKNASEVRTFLENGNSIFAECASIEVYENNPNGHFLTTTGILGEGLDGFQTPADYAIIYNEVVSPFPQIGDYRFIPDGGHLQSWIPFQSARQTGNTTLHSGNNGATGTPSVDGEYKPLVERFTFGDFDGDVNTTNDQWDIYIGGRADGDPANGYVVYLGGDDYTDDRDLCAPGARGSGTTAPNSNNSKTYNFTFDRSVTTGNPAGQVPATSAPYDEVLTISVDYVEANGTPLTAVFTDVTGFDDVTFTADSFRLEFPPGSVSGNSINGVILSNSGSTDLTVSSILVQITDGLSGQALASITDTGATNTYNAALPDFTITLPNSYIFEKAPPPPSNSTVTKLGGCFNSQCMPLQDSDHGTNLRAIAGIRYVLNTLFNLHTENIEPEEFVRSSPILLENYIFQGSFMFPGYRGHLRAYNIATPDSSSWDAVDFMPTNRKLFTANSSLDGLDSYSKPNSATTDMPTAYVNGVTLDNELGGIEHSAPAIIKPTRSNTSRGTVLYVGTLDGVLEAIGVDKRFLNDPRQGFGTDGEIWGYVPKSQIATVMNNRSIPGNASMFPGVDSSPTAKDVYIKGKDATPSWKAVLTVMNGVYGEYSSLSALDVTDPSMTGNNPNFDLLWETPQFQSDGTTPFIGQGHKTSMAVLRESTATGTVFHNYVFAATNVSDMASNSGKGGLRVTALDLDDGTRVTGWTEFEADYTDSKNVVPPAVTAVDMDYDGYTDLLLAGDMEGRLWAINARDGTNFCGTDPIYNAGDEFPIGVSAAVTRDLTTKDVIAAFGTGGASIADPTLTNSIIVINVTENLIACSGSGTFSPTSAHNLKINLGTGEQVWGSPTFAGGALYANTMRGYSESANPMDDKSADKGRTIAVDIGTGGVTELEASNQRGSVFVKDNKVIGTNCDGENKVSVTTGVGDPSAVPPINAHTVNWSEQSN